MADSLFDKRYRYDFIYPRGRSGETLRAVDIQNNDRPVVIKRPAPNDAPPMRAGQEVSINNERRALQALSGHPVLTELLDQGQFFVGGMPHQYIVMERAQGSIIGDEVIQLNANGERLPELETLVIIDQLLDLLYNAHSKDIVYNDVDAKHLFWNREAYELNVIDWGNAVFLEGDEITQQGISRQTDIYQVGELLYFIMTGGRRAEVPRDADADFAIDFGDDQRRVHSKLQEIISKALHPNSRLRYSNLIALRSDLSHYRAPIERERNAAVASISNKLKNKSLPMSELRILQTSIEPLHQQDPGYPPTYEAYIIIADRLRDLAVEADLDALRIYMENGNWHRSADLIPDLREKAGTRIGDLSNVFLDICMILIESNIQSAPEPIQQAIAQLFDGQSNGAALTLLADVANDEQRVLQWRIAERISAHMPEVLLLRPNLYRINTALQQIANDDYDVSEMQHYLHDIEHKLTQIANGNLDLAFLRDSYRAVVEMLTALNPLLQTFAAQHQLSSRRVPINSLERALSASMALADNMHVVGKQATQTRDALHALEVSHAIDSTNPIWGDLDDLLQRLYERLQSSQTYIPAADGSDLSEWLTTTQNKLQPFQERLFDDMLAKMVDDLGRASEAWATYQDVILLGNRIETLQALETATRAVSTVSPALSQWFRQLRTVVEGANYIERHALPGGLGRLLADGWSAYDRGRLADAERLGQQAYEIARNDTAQVVARRLQDLSKMTRDWVERYGVDNQSRSRVMLDATQNLFTEQETAMRVEFEGHMRSNETYLKVMGKGLVTPMANLSTAGVRTLFFFYLLQGTLDAHDGLLDDGEFWRDAAIKTLGEGGQRHVAVRTLDDYIIKQRDLIEAQRLFSRVNGKQILPELAITRNQLENNAQAKAIAPAIQSLRDIEVALRSWADGHFRDAGLKLEEAIHGVDDVEKSVILDLSGLRAWVMDMMEHAATLTVRARDLRELIEQRPDAPDDTIEEILGSQVTITDQLLGSDYTATLRQWYDTYVQFTEIYLSPDRRSPRLEQLNEFFRALFIDQHPTYPLFRHWYAILEAKSEFAAPITNDPTPQEQDEDEIAEIVYRDRSEAVRTDVAPPANSSNIGRIILFGGASIVALLVIGFVGFNLLNGDDTPEIALTISATPNEETQVAIVNATETQIADDSLVASQTAVALAPTVDEPTITREVTPTIIPTEAGERVISLDTSTPTPTETETSTPTPTIPTNTPTATLTPTLTSTSPPPSSTPLPEGGVRGEADLLALFNRTTELPFNPQTFFAVEGGYQLETDADGLAGQVQIVPSADFLNESYGNNAPSRITSVEADISLLTFDPALIDDEQGGVFFSLSLESADSGNNIGLQIEALDTTNSIGISSIENNTLTRLRTRSVGTIVVRLRIDRNIDTGNVILFVNDEQLLSEENFFAPDDAIIPVLSVRDGGVNIRIADWRIRLN